ncbi:MAG TPA: c-type cytochrome biogenesis protein CcsB, partial [Firmicutes bacterium]|nr:c-type cytochrome biogenesis protein CcsB [Bacillota bacterium]
AFLFLGSLIYKKRAVEKIGFILFFTGGISLFLWVVIRWIDAGYAPMSNTFETLILFAFLTAAVYAVFAGQIRGSAPAFGVAVVITIIIAVSSFFHGKAAPLMPALKSNWLVIHVAFSFVSYAAFAVAFVCVLIYLGGKEKNISMDDSAYRAIMFGFPFLTLGIVTGAVWADQAWGRYWSWDPKETWALITWLVYGIYLHLRLVSGWKGQKSAVLAVAGFGFVLFTYFGVNYLLTSIHSYK